jgi:hypothetical protein
MTLTNIFILYDKLFLWNIATVCGGISLLFLVIYVIGVPFSHPMDFNRNSYTSEFRFFDRSIANYFNIFPEVSLSFFTIEVMPLLCVHLSEVPHSSIFICNFKHSYDAIVAKKGYAQSFDVWCLYHHIF